MLFHFNLVPDLIFNLVPDLIFSEKFSVFQTSFLARSFPFLSSLALAGVAFRPSALARRGSGEKRHNSLGQATNTALGLVHYLAPARRLLSPAPLLGARAVLLASLLGAMALFHYPPKAHKVASPPRPTFQLARRARALLKLCADQASLLRPAPPF